MPQICHITSSHPVDDARIFDHELLSLGKRHVGFTTALASPRIECCLIFRGVSSTLRPVAGETAKESAGEQSGLPLKVPVLICAARLKQVNGQAVLLRARVARREWHRRHDYSWAVTVKRVKGALSSSLANAP